MPHLPVRAAEVGRTEAMEPLQRLGFDIVGVNGGAAPIHRAALNGHLETVRKLVDLGADPQLRDPNYNGNALSWAEHAGRQDVADYLRDLPQGPARW
jgi:ankyrin repeat protein